uniref:hypothetical protein n=1 Tax=Herbidospora sakaeratensis TaxID=564415 RepID=UPI000782C487|nr:hypothetical protein [Herbidospora sakaeratensis]
MSPEARPDPAAARTDAEFVAQLRTLKTWSGRSYRDIQLHAQRAGRHLPYSTAAGMLKRDSLPRQEALTAFVLGCGLDEQAATAWNTVRTRLDLGVPPEPSPLRPRRRPRWAAAVAALVVAAAALVLVGQADEEVVQVGHVQVLD